MMAKEEAFEKDSEKAELLHRIERLQETVCYLLARNEELRTAMREESSSREE